MPHPFTVHVLSPYQSAYPDPISFRSGDRLSVGKRDDEYPGWIRTRTPEGNEGWAPESIMQVSGQTAIASEDYDATEMTTQLGETLTVHRELAAWYWVSDESGKQGWVPKHTVSCID